MKCGESDSSGVGTVFADRVDAGRQLSHLLTRFGGPDVVVLGLPRGGVPVAFEVAQALNAPLDVIVVRKLGVPDQPELGMGALGEGGVRIINPKVVRIAAVGAEELAAVEAQERAMLDQRARVLRGDQPPVALEGRTAVIVDDGVATGSTARAACQVANARGANRVLLAAPVASADAISDLGSDADEVVCVLTPAWLSSIGQWYEDFSPTSDEEVRDLLARAAARQLRTSVPVAAPSPSVNRATPSGRDEETIVDPGGLRLPGHLTLPEGATGMVVFVHGSGSNRHSPRNRYVASVLNQAGLGTLLFDLLTRGEEADRANVFDIDLLADRLLRATSWLRSESWGQGMLIGWFGASTGAGAALSAAADPDARVSAIVSRGGRPDLAGAHLAEVQAPTLLIVGGLDTVVLGLNRTAQARLRCPNELMVVPGATHLFEEPGTLEAAAGLARDWFTNHLRPIAHAHPTSGQAG
jgi:putative phosphoribosyl transferase